MSEFEKSQRAAYQRYRKKLIFIETAVVVALLILTVIMSSVFVVLDKDTYVSFEEKGSVLYHAYLANNEYYEEAYLNGNHAYVSELIDKMDAQFSYRLEMDTEDVTYRYQYRVDAQLIIADKESGAAIYNPVETVLGSTEQTFTGKVLCIDPKVDIDYKYYNERAQKFISTYNLRNVTAELQVTMFVDVVGVSESFAQDSTGQYSIMVQIPLNQTTLKPVTSSTIPTGPQQVLAHANTHKTVFKVLAIILGILDGLCLIGTVAFVILTRDEHIDYARKVQKLLNNYKSYIQKIRNPLDESEYQVLLVDTFNEMLEIRDTLQNPILMYENEDMTCTRFMIPTYAKILYIFEIKVENYDQLYAEPVVVDEEPETVEEVVEEAVEETEIVVLEEVDEELLNEAVESPDIAIEEIEFEDNEVIEEREDGVEVISVVWPNKKNRGKLYRYDPNGEQVVDGDIVLVPSRDNAQNRDIIRKAAVAHGNHYVDPDTLVHPLKKIIAVVKRKAGDALGVTKLDVSEVAQETTEIVETVEAVETVENVENVENVEAVENEDGIDVETIDAVESAEADEVMEENVDEAAEAVEETV